jgi:hypothetical protein
MNSTLLFVPCKAILYSRHLGEYNRYSMGEFREYLDVDNLQEALSRSLERVYQHTRDRNIGIISARRNERTAEENNLAHASLRDDLRRLGYGYIHVRGRSVENQGTPQEIYVDEPSFLVIGKEGDDGGHLLNNLKKLGKKYNQDSILHKSHNQSNALLYNTKDFNITPTDVGNWHPNRATEFMTMLKGSRSFTFESVHFVSGRSFFHRKETLF